MSELYRVPRLCGLGFALILLPLTICAPASAQNAPAAPALKPADTVAANAAVTDRWPVEDTPQHSVGRPPTPSEPAVIDGPTPPPRGWPSMLPKEPAPDQAKAMATPKEVATPKVRHARKARPHVAKAKARTHVAKAKSTRVQHAAARPRTHAAARSHRPLTLTPAAVRMSRRS